MKNCLIVLQPREIPECMKSISDLPIDKLYLKGMTEIGLQKPINDFIKDTDYDNYIITSDDVIIPSQSFVIVSGLLEKHESATGYCRISQDTDMANVTKRPLKPSKYPKMRHYLFYNLHEIKNMQEPEFFTWFGGWCLTGFRRSIWLNNPFRVVKSSGKQSDYATCLGYNKKILCHKDAYVEHLRPTLKTECRRNFLVGKIEPQVIYEKFINRGQISFL